jgi:uncharacterized damage-inducible protein DinB
MPASAYIAEQIRRGYAGGAWHGPALAELLEDVAAEEAIRKPIAGAHSIWELVLHIGSWMAAAERALAGVPMPALPWAENFPAILEPTAGAWTSALARLEAAQKQLVEAAQRFPSSRLGETVPGRSYAYEDLLLGIAQHNAYHAGQIALLKKA